MTAPPAQPSQPSPPPSQAGIVFARARVSGFHADGNADADPWPLFPEGDRDADGQADDDGGGGDGDGPTTGPLLLGGFDPRPPPAPPPSPSDPAPPSTPPLAPMVCINNQSAYPDMQFHPLNDWEERFHAAYCASLTDQAACQRTFCGTTYNIATQYGTYTDYDHPMCRWYANSNTCAEHPYGGQIYEDGVPYDAQCDCADFSGVDCPTAFGCIVHAPVVPLPPPPPTPPPPSPPPQPLNPDSPCSPRPSPSTAVAAAAEPAAARVVAPSAPAHIASAVASAARAAAVAAAAAAAA